MKPFNYEPFNKPETFYGEKYTTREKIEVRIMWLIAFAGCIYFWAGVLAWWVRG
jgi:hypothetical protein